MSAITRLFVRAIHPAQKMRQGIKNQLFTETLTGLDLFVGPNGSGKTSRILAILAGVQGLATVQTDISRPYLGPLPPDTEVSLTVGSSVVTRDLSITRGKEYAATNAEIKRLIGFPPVSWDLSDFSSSTPGQRSKILDSVARAGGAIEAWDSGRAISEVWALVSGPEVDRLVRDIPTADDGASWLAAVLPVAETYATEARAVAKSAKSAFELAQLSCPEEPSNARLDDQRLADLQRQRAELVVAARDHAARVRSVEEHAARGRLLELDLASKQAEGARATKAESRPDETIRPDLVARVDAARAALHVPIPAPGVDLVVLGERVSDRESTVRACEVALQGHREALSVAETRRRASDGEAERASETVRDIRSRLAGLGPVTTVDGGVCRACGAADPLGHAAHAEEVRREREALAGQLADAVAEEQRAIQARHEAEAEESAASRAVGQSEARTHAARLAFQDAVDALEAGRRAAESHEPRIRREREEALSRAESDVGADGARIAREVQAWERREADRVARLGDLRASWTAARDALAVWRATPAPTVPADDTQERIAVIDSEIRQIRDREEIRASIRARRAEVRRLARVSEEASAALDRCVALVSAIRATRDRLAAGAYQPIHDAARALVSGIDGLPTPFFHSPSEYGAEIDGVEVLYHGLSESERRITAACLVYALAVVGRQPCRMVLIDGIEVIQRSHRGPLLRALVRAREAGLVDTVVLTQATDPDEEVEAIEGVTIHRLTRGGPVAESMPEAGPVVETARPKPIVAPADDGCPF